MEQNHPQDPPYKWAWVPFKGEFGHIFYTQKNMSCLRHTEAVFNSRRKRGEKVRELLAYDAY